MILRLLEETRSKVVRLDVDVKLVWFGMVSGADFGSLPRRDRCQGAVTGPTR